MEWQTFVPADGVSDLSANDSMITLWNDYDSLPANWQKVSVDGVSLFWVRIDVTTPFTTAPIGGQLTAASGLAALRLRR